MNAVRDRRQFLQTGVGTVGTGAALAGLGNLAFLGRLAPVSAAESQLQPGEVQLRSEIAPVVRLLEQTPRDRLLEEVADRIRKGLSYRELLAALLLAGVKNVEPRPSVGHKFHTVLVVNSAHLASTSSPPEHRWLPIFWALDYFKSAQQRDVEERGDWTMAPVDESAVPPAHKATAAFRRAMDNWDTGAADTAVASLARTAGANQVYELLFRYGARDYRSIGHKAIYVANSWRTLQSIGWQHSEPVLRSLAYALLAHEGGNPRDRDAEADRPFRRNQELAQKFRTDWQSGTLDESFTTDMLATLRNGSNDDACDQLVELVNRGAAPTAIWDALHLRAAEMLMSQPGIVALHAVTSTNALYFAFTAAADDQTRRLIMLQNAAFLPMFGNSMSGRGRVKQVTLDDLQCEPGNGGSPAALDEIFAELGAQPMAAAGKVLGYLDQPHSAKELIDAARLLVFLKGNNAHDYKFSSAVLEDYYHVSRPWRDRYLAANIFKLRSSVDRDNELVARTRAALNV